MTYTFGDNNATLRRARALAEQLLAAADDLAAGGSLSVKYDHHDTFYLLYGWWRAVNRSTRAFHQLIDAGFTIEAVPLIRGIIEHTYAIIWLADVGADGIAVIEDVTWDNRRKMINNMRDTGWPVPRDVEIGDRPQVPAADTSEGRRHATLKGEFERFSNQVIAVGTADIYPVYRHLSDHTHASAHTANAFLHLNGDGSASLRFDADVPMRVDTIWATVCLIQTGRLISPRIANDPLHRVLDKAVRELGLPPGYMPQRIG